LELEGDLDYQVALDMHRRKLLQEEIDRKQAAPHMSSTLTDEAQLEALEDVEIDLNNLDQQQSEHQRLQSGADKKPAAKKNPPNDDRNKKMPAVVRQQTTTPQPRNHHRNEQRETAARQQLAARPSQRPNAGISLDGVVDMTQCIVQVRGTGPPNVDHPVFSPPENKIMRKDGIRVFGGKIYAPEESNMYLKRFWEKKPAEGKLCQDPTPSSTSSDDSDSTPPKCNQQKPTVARKKPPIKKPTDKGEKPPPNRTFSAAVVFTGPPPNATEAEINQWVSLWYRHHSTRTTQEGIVQCLTPGRTTPQWVQTWADNAHAQVARLAAANASSNNPGTNTLEENPLAPPAAAVAHDAPPPDATEAEISKAVSAWISSHRITVTDGVIQCLDPDQTVPQCVQDRMDHNVAQIKSLKQEGHRKAKRTHQQLPATRSVIAPQSSTTSNSGLLHEVCPKDPCVWPLAFLGVVILMG